MKIAVQSGSQQVPRFGRFEAVLTVDTDANPYLPYDASPPRGIQPGTGIRVDALLLPPGVTDWSNAVVWPCFWREGMRGAVEEVRATGENGWYLRFAPDRTGRWRWKVRARDRSGAGESEVRSFTVTPSPNRGFARVARADRRYFEFSDGSVLPPIPGTHENSPTSIAALKGSFTLCRTWWNGTAALYSPWDLGGQGGRRDWGQAGLLPVAPSPGLLSARTGIGGKNPMIELLAARGEAGKRYRWRALVKTENVAGPAKPNERRGIGANYGPALRLTDNADGTDAPVNKTWLHGDTDWTWIGGDFTLTRRQGNFRWMKMGLVNCTRGQAYWHEATLREVRPDGSLGPELLETPNINRHARYSQVAAHRADMVLAAAAASGVLLKLCLFEKQSHLFGELTESGQYGPYSQTNIYGGPDPNVVGANRWYQRAAVRYFMARYGWSPAVHSVELLNEGDPANPSHVKGAAVHFIRYVHSFTYRKMMANTTFWHSFVVPEGADYADQHEYIEKLGKMGPDWPGLDTARLMRTIGDSRASRAHDLNKPYVWGEIGLGGFKADNTQGKGGTEHVLLAADRQGTWLHKATWANLGPHPAYLLWWWQDAIRAHNLYTVPAAFRAFTAGIPFNNGRYRDAKAETAGGLQAVGQKDVQQGHAHLWINNPAHTWIAAARGAAVPPCSGTVTVAGFTPGTYRIQWWDTRRGQVSREDTARVARGAPLTLRVQNLASDVAVKVIPARQAG